MLPEVAKVRPCLAATKLSCSNADFEVTLYFVAGRVGAANGNGRDMEGSAWFIEHDQASVNIDASSASAYLKGLYTSMERTGTCMSMSSTHVDIDVGG
jgi:hypothetical protein